MRRADIMPCLSSEPSKRRPVVLLASGTLGDILPMLGLGRALREAGNDIRIVTHSAFRTATEAHGLDWAPLEGNPNALLADPVFAAALRLDGQPLRSLRDTLRFVHAAGGEVARMLHSAWHAARDAGCIVVGLPTSWGQTIAERLDVPCVWMLCQPLGRTGAFPSPLQPWSGSPGRAYNRLSHVLAEQSLWRPWRAQLERWRGELGLPRRDIDPFAAARRARSPFVYLHSPALISRPLDWPRHYVVAGHWRAHIEPGWQPAPELGRFLAAGSPVFAGFGSMAAGRERELARLLFEAAVRSGRRIVLQLSRPDLAPAAPPEVLVIGPAPHQRLLGHMAAAIHHGGAGTTHATLRAGLPGIAIPFGVDQHFWGRRVAVLGAGLPPLSQRRLAEQLVPSIERLLGDPVLKRNAQHLARLMRDEDGIAVAARITESVLGEGGRDDKVTG